MKKFYEYYKAERMNGLEHKEAIRIATMKLNAISDVMYIQWQRVQRKHGNKAGQEYYDKVVFGTMGAWAKGYHICEALDKLEK